jgi:hypothetical protein
VLALLALLVAVAVPALRRPPPPAAGLESLLPIAREAAVRRGETLRLRLAASGEWSLQGGTADGTIAAGRVSSGGADLTLVVSPLGTCGFDGAAARAPALPLDPLTCELRPQPATR